MADILVTPVGRLVWGDAFKGSDTDFQGKPRLTLQNLPKTLWQVGLAIQKNDPQWPALWAALYAAGQAAFPQGAYQSPSFSWKVKDGDSLDNEGKRRLGYCIGHWILNLASGYAPSVFDANNCQIDPKNPTVPIKRGDFIKCAFTVTGNDQKLKPGIYVNLQMIKFVAYGEAITSADPDVFGSAPETSLPPGASLTPISGGMPSMPPAAGPGYAPPAAGPGYAPPAAGPGYAPPAAGPGYAPPAAGPGDPGYAPHPGFLNPATGQPYNQ